MEIILLDNKREMCQAWRKYFSEFEGVKIICEYLEFADLDDVDCYVSPANSYGLMDGGYDKALTMLFGVELQRRVQDYIINNLYGEQQVGSSIIVDIPGEEKKLIHTPTMRVPARIKDPEVVYTSMRSTLICALKNNVGKIVIPAFGGATGGLAPDVIAEEMFKAYIQVFKININIHSWEDLCTREDIMYSYLNKK